MAWIARRENQNQGTEPTREGVVLSSHSLPKKFYTGQLQEESNCYIAYVKLAELCGMASEKQRTWLATLLTNCHLEGAGRKTIQWHPEHALRDVSPQEYSLVSRYIPLISDICDRTGNAHHLAMFQMRVDHDKKLWANIAELEEAVTKATEVNHDSERLFSRFDEVAEDALTRTKHLEDLTTHLGAATKELNQEHKELRMIQNDIQDSMTALSEEKRALAASALNFAQVASEKILSVEESIELRNSYNELLTKYATLKENIHRETHKESMSELESRDHLWQRIFPFRQSSGLVAGVWFEIIPRLLWTSLMAPFRMTRILESLRMSGMLSGQGESIIVAMQIIFSSIGVILCYRVIVTLKTLAANGSSLRDFLDGSLQTLKALTSHLRSVYDRRSGEHSMRRKQAIVVSEEDKKVLLLELMKIADTLLDERLQTYLAQCIQSVPIDAALTDKLKEFLQAYDKEISKKICRIEKRQIIIFQKLREAQETTSLAYLKDTGQSMRRSRTDASAGATRLGASRRPGSEKV